MRQAQRNDYDSQWVSSISIEPQKSRGKDMRPMKPERKVRISEKVDSKKTETPEWAAAYTPVARKRKSGEYTPGQQRVNSVSDRRHGDMSVMAVKEGQWERIQITVDSGAMRNVFPKNVAEAFEIKESVMSKAGINFVAANDTVIKNYGSRQIMGLTEG